MGAAMRAMAGKMAGDQIVKAGISDYAMEYFEIAFYEAIVEAAKACEEDEIASVCEGIIEEEEAMGEWLRAHLPETTHRFLETKAEK